MRSTEIVDCNGNEIYYFNTVRVLSPSGGKFFRNNQFQVGAIAEVYGINSIHHIKIRDPNDHKLKTIRDPENLQILLE